VNLWVIQNALPLEFATRAATFLDREIPRAWWYRAVQGAEKIPDEPDNASVNEWRIRQENRVAAEGGFAYSFRRTVANHHATCNCPVCKTLTLFATSEFMARVSAQTAIDVSELGHCFASHYGPGDFLSTHTDKDNGKIAFVWNLTIADWKPQWGGLLHLLDPTWKHVEMSITPAFNTLVLFDVRGEGRPHFVSPVIAGVREKRLAISGWFS
jgi:hypothetical protein